MRILAAILLITIALTPLHPDSSNETVSAQKDLVRFLFDNRLYFDCISESGRLIHLDSTSGTTSDYSYFILLNYYYGGQHLSIIQNIDSKDKQQVSPRFRLMYAYSLFKSGHTEKAIDSLSVVNDTNINADMRNELMLRRIDLMLHAGEYESAIEETVQAGDYMDPEKTAELQQALSSFRDINTRSPLKAAGLSALAPGAGHIYAGAGIPSGALTLLSVVLPAAASWYAFDNNNRQAGYTAAAFTSLFYAGGIYSAWNSANRTNIRNHNRFRKEFRAGYIPEYNPEDYIEIDRLLK